MYKIYFVEVSFDGQENETFIGDVPYDDIYEAYMFIADYMRNSGSINCFMIPCKDEDDDSVIYVDILTVPHYFAIIKLLN